MDQIPRPIRIIPVNTLANGRKFPTTLTPITINNPIKLKTTINPSVKSVPNLNPSSSIAKVPFTCLSEANLKPTYAGNIAIPHGLKAAIAPAVNAK